MAHYLEGLNEEQKKAVTAGDGPILVVAGAGSGKTRVLTNRIAYLMDEMDVSARQIMALTFTNKAAKEMETRLANLLEADVYGLWVGTFHRICLRILRMEGEAIGINSDFVIYDDADQRSLVKSLLKQQGVDDCLTPAAVLCAISDAKNEMVAPEAYEEMAFTDEEETISNIYKKYEAQKKANNALDFDDLLLYVVELFTTCHDVLTDYRERFPYILVDEYQDTNEAQYRILRLLAGKEGNIFVVGDPDQSIYAFRGAKIENILNFHQDYPNAQVYRLEKNYRSTMGILKVANALIKHNGNRLEKELYSDKTGENDVEAVLLADEKAEAYYVADKVKYCAEKGKYCYRDMAVFYRTHAQSRALEDMLQKNKIPYKVFGGQKYYDRKEIKDTMAYLRVIMNPDDNVSLLRIINEPRRGIGGMTVEKLEDLSVANAVSIWHVLDEGIGLEDMKPAAKRALTVFTDIIRELRIFALDRNVTEITAELWQKSGYKAALEKENNIENMSRLENMEEFLSVTSDYDKSARFEEEGGSLADFLASISLSSDLDNFEESDDYLTLMTIHMAKGLEFPIVFLMGMEESIFPHVRSILSGNESDIEEERRLCYVGVTRAMDELKILRTYRRTLWGRTMYNKPSRFLEEMNIKVPEKKGAKSNSKTIEPKEFDDFCLGDKVNHCKFGEGVIVFVDNENGKAKVAFPGLGVKEFLLAYANLEKA
jgi:DNA helicase-2/ATP-dependent DNA helicase PcrA